MSGHSKWHNIRLKKGKMDAARGKTFTRLARDIIVAARTGGKLRLSAGTLYGLVKRLLEDGLIVELRESQRPEKPQDDERRRYYRLTPLGRKAAKAEVNRMAELLEQARTYGLVAKSN